MADAPERSLRELVGDLSIDLRLLCLQLVEVARAETRTAVRTATASIIGIAAGAITALIGVLVLAAALVLGAIAAGLPPWAAALVVGLVLVAGGGTGAALYARRLRGAPFGLPETRASFEETLTWLKAQTGR